MIDKELYHEFRYFIDEKAFDAIKESSDYVQVVYEGKIVGFLIVHDGYIEGAYIRDAYRRKGLMRETVRNYVKRYGMPDHLHIVNGNTTAYEFWSSIFDLRAVDHNLVDTYYFIAGWKK
jgi:hypothetical protein